MIHKHILLALTCLMSLSIFAEEMPEGYYDRANGLKDAELKDSLKSIIRKHHSMDYGSGIGSTWEVFFYSDRNEEGYIMDMYCDEWKKVTTPGEVAAGCNIEHSFAKSWWGGSKNDAYEDCYHLNPSNNSANGSRSNYPLGVPEKDFKTGTGSLKVGKRHHDELNQDHYVFEPKDEYKGDFARAYFYMATCYGHWSDGTVETVLNPYSNKQYYGWYVTNNDVGAKFAMQNDNYLEFQPWEQEVLIIWHRQDPVSTKEIKRADAVSDFQHNRNPFIDYPFLAEYIWGDRAGEELNMADLMASFDDDFIPGESDGWRGGGTPITPKPKFGVTWIVNGEEVQVDSIVENKSIKALPQAPTSCSSVSNLFVGWTTEPLSGTSDEAPEVLFTQAKDLPAVTADIAYYAVFARKTVEDTDEPAEYTFDASHQEGWTNTGISKSGYWLYNASNSLVSPEVNLAGLTSITAKIRTFGGTGNNTMNISANGEQIGSLVTNKGTALTDIEWINDKTLTGKAPITFSSNYTGSNAGVGLANVTIRTTGATVTIDRYLTTCDGAEAISEPRHPSPARKVLINGQLYLMYQGTMYNVQGWKVN